MCCTYDEKATNELREALKSGARTFYKVYGVNANKMVIAPYRGEYVEVKDGAIVSDRQTIGIEDGELSNGVGQGIHVTIEEINAESRCTENEFIIPVLGRAEDLIATDGKTDAVFMKVFVDEEELKRRATATEYVEGDDSFDDDDDDDWDDDDDDFDYYDDDDDDDWDDEDL